MVCARSPLVLLLHPKHKARLLLPQHPLRAYRRIHLPARKCRVILRLALVSPDKHGLAADRLELVHRVD